MKYSEIVEQVSRELDLPIELVNKTYRAYWLFIKHIVQNQPIESIDTEEEFVKLKFLSCSGLIIYSHFNCFETLFIIF